MNLESRSRSFSSLFSITTCFKASCAGEPSFSHFVFRRAVAEIGSCGQQLYSTDESQLCLSTTWCNMLIHFSLSSSAFPSRHSRPPKMICYRFNPGVSSSHPFFFAFFASLDLMFLQRCQTFDLVLNSTFFVFGSHQCFDSGMSICTHDFHRNSTV